MARNGIRSRPLDGEIVLRFGEVAGQVVGSKSYGLGGRDLLLCGFKYLELLVYYFAEISIEDPGPLG